jgi:glycosyltransferase involved in cell wall biosynthesis
MRLPDSVSVVIPCYNGAAYLRDTIGSALAQTHRPLEIIVVDDGSRDDSAAVARAFGPPVIVIEQENQGESVARNRGMNLARGEWIAFLDADDQWQPDKTARQLAAATPDTVAVVSNIRFFGRENYDAPRWNEPPEVRSSLEYICALNAFIPSTLMVRASVPIRFPEWTKHGEDYVFSVELSLAGRIAFVDEPLTRYRLHAGSQSHHPASLVRWDETIARWLDEHTPQLGRERVAAIRRRQVEQLVERARRARLARRWDTFDAITDHLQQYTDIPAVADLLSERTLPRWTYRVVDAADRVPFVKSARTKLFGRVPPAS